jgi:hypothetical protein
VDASLTGRHTIVAFEKIDRFARRTHSHFHFGTHRNPFDERSNRCDEERITFVSTVVSHVVTEQTTRDPDARSSTVMRHDVHCTKEDA